MDLSLLSRKNIYWILMGVMGLAEIIVIIAYWIVGRLNKWHEYQLGYEKYLGSEQFFYLLDIGFLLWIAIFILAAAMAFCMSRISLIAMESEPERAKAHKNDAMAYLVLMAFMLMFSLGGINSRILHLMGTDPVYAVLITIQFIISSAW